MMSSSPAYANLSRRVGAVLVAGVFIGITLFAAIFIISQLSVPPPFDIVLTGLLVGSIKPLLVSLSGGSPGHHVAGKLSSTVISGLAVTNQLVL